MTSRQDDSLNSSVDNEKSTVTASPSCDENSISILLSQEKKEENNDGKNHYQNDNSNSSNDKNNSNNNTNNTIESQSDSMLEFPNVMVTSASNDDNLISTNDTDFNNNNNNSNNNDGGEGKNDDEVKSKDMDAIEKELNKTPYVVMLNSDSQNRKTHKTTNFVRTTKYMFYNFLILFAIDQAKRYYNIFFIMVMIFSLIPNVSPVTPITSIGPVVFILGSAAIREIYEDVLRWKADRKANSKKVCIIKNGEEQFVASNALRVGDIVKINADEEFPADILAISCSENSGVVKIETSSLDGETNIKVRKCCKSTIDITSLKHLNKLQGFVACQKPTAKLTQFIASICIDAESLEEDEEEQAKKHTDDYMFEQLVGGTQAMDLLSITSSNHGMDNGIVVENAETRDSVGMKSMPSRKVKEKAVHHRRTSSLLAGNKTTVTITEGMSRTALNADNLLLRGATLVNTEYVYGIVLYVGKETKLLKNYKKGKSKFSYLDQRLNSFLLLQMVVHQIFSIAAVAAAIYFQDQWVLKKFYISPLENEQAGILWIIRSYLTNFILYNLFIPMSLFVSLEFVKTFQLSGMSKDRMMWDSKDFRFKGNTSNLNADLSQIEIIFSDKTGTLTQNEMVFKRCAVRGGYVFDEMMHPGSIKDFLLHNKTPPIVQSSSEANFENEITIEDEDYTKQSGLLDGSTTIASSLNSSTPNHFIKHPVIPTIENIDYGTDRFWLTELFACLALCQSINVEKDKKTGEVKYDGESPDEVELVNMAARVGIKVMNKSDTWIMMGLTNANGETIQVKYNLLETLSFTSERARSSVIVYPDHNPNHLVVYSKGADAKLIPRLRDDKERQDIVVRKKLDEFALSGLRTLLICRRIIDREFYENWNRQFQKILNDVNANEKTRKKEIDRVTDLLESNYEIIGATAIEDRLQDYVPETIAFFRDAGIQMWMLTGDKHETAENIARSAKMVNKHKTKCFEAVKTSTFDDCISKLDEIKQRMIEELGNAKKRKSAKVSNQSQRGMKTFEEVALVVDGQTLNFIFGDAGDAMNKKRALQKIAEDVKRRQQRMGGVVRGHANSVVKTISSKKISDSPQLAPSMKAAVHAVSNDKNQDKAKLDPEIAKIQAILAAKQKKCFQLFVDVCKLCVTVIVCRSSPVQKALMVRMVLKKYNKIGLAIGDGLNDVSMIQEARVGIGIMGKEGSQASRASDYSIPSFKHLRRLLAVYGRYSLIRTALFVQYSFYKNMVLVFAQIFFSIFCMFTGQTIIESMIITFYNMLFTLLPPFLMGLFEKDIDEEIIERHPEIYREFRSLHLLDYISFVRWCIQALIHGIIIFFVNYGILRFSDSHFSYDGVKDDGLWYVAGQMGLIITFVVNVKAIIAMSSYNIVTVLCLIGTFISIPVFHLVYSIFNSSNMFFITFVLFTSPKFYLSLLLCTGACILPDFAYKYIVRIFWPSKWEILQWKYAKVKGFREEMRKQDRYKFAEPTDIELQENP